MKLAIIDYNAGNVRSVLFAMQRIGVEAILTDNIELIQSADKVIFPGVGEASTTMQNLRDKKLDKVIPFLKQPVLGICVGMQLLCSYSEENDTPCLGVFPQKVIRFQATDNSQKVPHTGWNSISKLKNGIFSPDLENQYVYYVHSYHAEIGEYTTAVSNYIVPFSAGLQKDNFYATQFHPEKSGSVGEQILKNFLAV